MLKIIFKLLIATLPLAGFQLKVPAQDTSKIYISIHVKDASLKEVIQTIEKVTDFKFMASAEDVENEKHITMNVTNLPLMSVLDLLFSKRGIEYRIADRNIFLKKLDRKQTTTGTSSDAPATRKRFTLHGTVKAQKTGEMLIGATLSVADLSIGRVSNEYGFYSLSLPKGDFTLLVSTVGMNQKQIRVSLVNDLRLDISLEEAMASLQEVTVTPRSSGAILKNPQMGMEKINVQELRNIPVLFVAL